MLSINSDNCARFKKEFTDPWAVISENDTKGFSQIYPEFGEIIVEKGGNLSQFCDYVNWADISGVSLQGTPEDWANIRT